LAEISSLMRLGVCFSEPIHQRFIKDDRRL